MKAIIYSFRNEYHLSGQYRATSQMIDLFKELGWDIVTFQDNSSTLHKAKQLNLKLLTSNLKRLFFGCAVLNQTDGDLVIIRIPCLSQLIFIRFLYNRLNKPLIVLLESLAWNGENKGSFLRELRFEPILAISKRIINHPIWGKLAGPKPETIVCASRTQLEQAKKYISGKRSYHQIENSFMETDPSTKRRPDFDLEKVKIGFIGHDLVYKGVIEIAEAIKLLRKNISHVELLGAFSGMGFNAIQKYWVKSGGQVLGEVDTKEFFNSIDILCYPIYEDYGSQVYPLVILEAMRQGVPLITSKTSALMELLDPNVIPMVDQVSDVSISEAVNTLLKKDANEISSYLKERYARISRPHVKEKWRDLLGTYKK